MVYCICSALQRLYLAISKSGHGSRPVVPAQSSDPKLGVLPCSNEQPQSNPTRTVSVEIRHQSLVQSPCLNRSLTPFLVSPRADSRLGTPVSRSVSPVSSRTLVYNAVSKLRKHSSVWFDRLTTNGEIPVLSVESPFALSLSKGEQGFSPQPA